MRTISEFYDDDDPNRPGHPEFDINVRKPATPKTVYLVSGQWEGKASMRFDELYHEARELFGCHNVDVHSCEIRANFDDTNDLNSDLFIEFTVTARIEDLKPAMAGYDKWSIETKA